MTAIEQVELEIAASPRRWLVTGVAGFIGCNLLEALLNAGQEVVGLDSFATGHRANLEDVRRSVGDAAWRRFCFHEGDIRQPDDCRRACDGADYVLHQAALGSVPRSVADPIATNQANIDGFLHMLVAARDAGVKRFIYAGSSSTYGDHPALPKREEIIGKPLSPYAITKYVNELYAEVFGRTYGISWVGLRYFNVFGIRQDPNGAYAAVIPRWIGELLHHSVPTINGSGDISRDFCYIDNVVQANLLAAVTQDPEADRQVYNVACGERTTLAELFALIRESLSASDSDIAGIEPIYGSARTGDIPHSQADITKATERLGYRPRYGVRDGIRLTTQWYVERAQRDPSG